MPVVCKFVCKVVSERQSAIRPIFDATFLPVNPDLVNDRLFHGMAGGQIQLVGLEEKVFVAGKVYEITFSEVEK